VSGSDLNPPELAEAINAKGFMGAAGFRIVAVKPGHAEIAFEVFSRSESSETLCAFGTATMRAMDLPDELRQPWGLNP